MSNEVRIRCKDFEWCATEFRISPTNNPAFNGMAALIFATGASSAQTYATREELLALADMLREHAESMVEATQ